jgi:DNA-binding transcriptional MerR regulator
MTINNDDLLNSIMESLNRIENIKVEDIPNIDLYMDQLTTFMDEKLRRTTRYPLDDKILTKTMINNYAKNDLLPPPVRKKYSKDHLILLIFIYYFKNILSINDIQTLLDPVKERFHVSDTDGLTLSDIYREIYALEDEELTVVEKDIKDKYEKSLKSFDDAPEEMKDRLQAFSFMALLAYDVYVKKLIIEKMLDGFSETEEDGKSKKKDKKNKE